MRYRHERFGGIVSSEDPPLLAWVDREMMLELGLGDSPLWDEPEDGTLAAPTEVHLTLTRRCNLRCPHCYTDSSPEGPEPLSTADAKEIVDELARMGVFHLALGGGESFLRADLFEIAAYARSKGIVPNLTTNGFAVDRTRAERSRVFGRVNVSFDGVGPKYRLVRVTDGFDVAMRGVRFLQEAGVEVGANVVVTRENFDHLQETVEFAAGIGLADLEFLRLKPGGRGAHVYELQKMTRGQGERIFPLVLAWMERYGIEIKLDCSFTPFVCWHEPDPETLERFCVVGCDGGNSLAGIGADGGLRPCSFEGESSGDARSAREDWTRRGILEDYRRWTARAPMPCRECPYLSVCKGGCHVVARRATGTVFEPDPDCPRVLAWREGGATRHGEP